VSTSLIITKEFNLGGYHFTREIIRNNAAYNIKVQAWLHDHGKLASVSAHSLDEIKAFAGGFDHVLVSPVFESISKVGHQYAWNFPELKNMLAGLHSLHPAGMSERTPSRFFAVGGVDVPKIPEIKAMHFDGFAVLGALWQEPAMAVERFIDIKRHCAE
jgi:thiamine-phosphate pyrophosphorylase